MKDIKLFAGSLIGAFSITGFVLSYVSYPNNPWIAFGSFLAGSLILACLCTCIGIILSGFCNFFNEEI